MWIKMPVSTIMFNYVATTCLSISYGYFVKQNKLVNHVYLTGTSIMLWLMCCISNKNPIPKVFASMQRQSLMGATLQAGKYGFTNHGLDAPKFKYPWIQRSIDSTTLDSTILNKTSLMRRLQAQSLPDATPPIGKIYPSRKITVSF